MTLTAPARVPARLIDGKAFAESLRARTARRVESLIARSGTKPGLAVVLVGENPASQVYVRNKAKQTVEAGMESFEHRLPESTTEAELLALVDRLNRDAKIHGILGQLPLPKQIDADAVLLAIDPAKDVDGFHVVNVGRLATGAGDAMVPCTPLGCLMLLKDTLGPLAGARALVLGRSNIVGKPMAALLIAESCTVTVAHSKTRELAEECRRADILIAAVGKPRMVQGDWIKPGATVIDVGINRIAEHGKQRLVGDVDFDAAVKIAGAITPVPGGVGPMTIACLLANTLTAACRRAGLDPESL
ncbi:MAG: bifunctional methylenetetrahydrofolate dehydrogenase/methenyltetrahydrofolate cyclohydrolase FolD [Rhodospirillales bacterium]|nr:bifunctional methylenetetrahydrofolate dehydrogenase/methenyltetrahydrofolate cyclohydrolase FolD [Rhodospirillales bacterium]